MYSKLSNVYLCLYFKHVMSYKAIIIGASGLIGSELLKHVTEHREFGEVVLITRRPLDIYNKKTKQVVIDFDNLNSISREISGDVIYSCLGSTRKKTPDAAEYRKIEYDYTLNIARIGLNNGVKQFHYISSLGADVSSPTSYLRLKGEVEKALIDLPYPALHIYQPSYLRGNRAEKRLEDMLMKPIMSVLDPLLLGKFSKYKSIAAASVAKAMIKQTLTNNKGVFIHPSNIIKELA